MRGRERVDLSNPHQRYRAVGWNNRRAMCISAAEMRAHRYTLTVGGDGYLYARGIDAGDVMILRRLRNGVEVMTP